MTNSKYEIIEDISIPEDVLRTWQDILDLMAKIIDVPAGLIMKAHPREIEVLVRSSNPENVYKPGEKAKLDTGLYCEAVMSTQKELVVPNALKDPAWDSNPDIPLGMISYLGLPLSWPNGEVFGTVCVLDKKENQFDDLYAQLVDKFRHTIQLGLKTTFDNHNLLLMQEKVDASQKKIEAASLATKTTIDYMSQGILMVDGDENVLTINDRLLDFLDIPKERHGVIKSLEVMRQQLRKANSFGEESVDRVIGTARDNSNVSYDITSLDGRIFDIRQNPLPESGYVRTYTDITERKLIEESIQAMFENNPAPMAVRHIDPVEFVRVNDAFCKLFGLKNNEMLKLDPKEIWYAAEEREIFVNSLDDKGNGKDIEVRIKNLVTGDLVEVLASSSNITYEGEPALLMSAVDITHRRQIEENLREEQERLSFAMRGGNLGFWEQNKSTNRFVLKNMYEEVLGYESPFSDGDFITDTDEWTDLIHPDDAENAKRDFYNAFSGKTSEHRIEYRVKAADGSWKWLLVMGNLITDAKGNPSDRIAGVMVNISQRKSMEDALRTEQQRLNLALRGGHMGLWEYERTAKQLTLSSILWGEILGYELELGESQSVMPPEAWADLIHPDDSDMATNALKAVLVGDTCDLRAEYRVKASDGTWKYLLVEGREISDEGSNPTGRVLGVIHDISGLKQIENDLNIAKEEAEAASDAKASFLASMSHEIRTPMNGVVGMVDLLTQTEMDSEQIQMLQTVRDSGQSLLTIINDILDFSKIEAGKLDLEAIDTPITDLMETSAQSLAPNAISKNVQIITFIDPEIPRELQLDPVRVRQIIINLGSNAVKFSSEGEVVIKAELVNSEKKKVTVRFSVIDQGIGISEEAQADLFQEFSQADSSTTRNYGGTGLGLAISKRLTELMGGTIGVNSELGLGSTFYCELPLVVPDSAKKDEKDSGRVDLAGLHVLLVSPSKNYQDVCCHYLQHWKAYVTTIADINSCLSVTQELAEKDKPIDIIAIPFLKDHNKIAAIREQFLHADMMPYPRFAIGDDPRKKSEVLRKLPEITMFSTNPLSRAGFVSAVAIAAGRASPEILIQPEAFKIKGGRAPTPGEALEQGKLILLAEDNITNQDVISRQLMRIGYACELANDGKEAYDMWRKKTYALLLTDCHMPEWDGFELTEAIRKDEESTSKRAPIIAITANALQGEAEKCIEGGMDDYMSKPVEMKALQAMLYKWMGDGGIASDEPKPAPDKEVEPDKSSKTSSSTQDNGSINERKLKELFGDDEETFKEILTEFLIPSQSIIGEIHLGFKNRSAKEIQDASHKLKSAAFSCGAEELGELCKALEAAAIEANWAIIDAEVPKIDGLMNLVEEYISQL